jgi:hypothetical protein
VYKNLTENHEEKELLTRPKRTWEYKIKMELKERGHEDQDWKHVTWEWDQWRALVNMVMNLWIP